MQDVHEYLVYIELCLLAVEPRLQGSKLVKISYDLVVILSMDFLTTF